MTELEYKGFKCNIYFDEGKYKVIIEGMMDGQFYETPGDTLRGDISSMEEAEKIVEPVFHATVERELKKR